MDVLPRRINVCVAISLVGFLFGCSSESRDQSTEKATRYEHLVCQAQFDRVTFVNNDWTGEGDSERPDIGDLDTCPYVWDFLDEKGEEGWELVSVISKTSTDDEGDYPYLQLFLKRRTSIATQQ